MSHMDGLALTRRGRARAHPTTGIKFFAAIGTTVPPIEDPTATNPIANPRLSLNQCAITAVVGPKIPPQANYDIVIRAVVG